MIVKTSYKLRDGRVQSTVSIPNPTVKSLTEVLHHVAWIARQQSPEIVVES